MQAIAGGVISIHAPLAGCDQKNVSAKPKQAISIHAPLAGCDRRESALYARQDEFQSTHPLRGATNCRIATYYKRRNFNPRTPCGVRPNYLAPFLHDFHFNPRTPCGVRRVRRRGNDNGIQFQSTHPLRGATDRYYRFSEVTIISIHAPLAGCDRKAIFILACIIISIHAPLAGCDFLRTTTRTRRRTFQSTHPLRGATDCSPPCMRGLKYFNPRTPCGVRLYILCQSEARTANKGRTH